MCNKKSIVDIISSEIVYVSGGDGECECWCGHTTTLNTFECVDPAEIANGEACESECAFQGYRFSAYPLYSCDISGACEFERIELKEV